MIPRRKAHLYPGELAEVRRWLESGVPSDSLAKWEAGVAELVGVGGAAAVCSGRIAMVIVLNHLGIGPGDEVILPAYTLKDLATLIEGTGARAVPADIDLLTLYASPASVEGRITSRTKAILALHAFGSPCRIREMCALGKKHGIHVIEDCAHALGAHVEGRSVGSFGTAAFFSFETTKPVNTFGGGMLVSDDAALITEARAANAQGAIDLQGLRRKIRSVQVERFMFATGLSFPLLYLLASPRWSGLVAHLYRQAQSVPRQDASYMPIQAALAFFLPFLTTGCRSGRVRWRPWGQPGDFPRVCGAVTGVSIWRKSPPRLCRTRSGVNFSCAGCQGRGRSLTTSRARNSCHCAKLINTVQRSHRSGV